MRRRTVLIATAIALGLVAGCGGDDATDETAVPSDFQITGTWTGELTQKDVEPFDVTATIGNLDDPKQNTVHYTGIDCGGNWTYLRKDGEAFRFREVIDRGAGGECKGTGVVTLTPTGPDAVAYEFIGGGIESQGTLHRSP